MRRVVRHAASTPIVCVNDVQIPAADIAREVQYQKASTPGAAWKAAAQALVVRELLRQRIATRGLHAVPRSEGGRRETDEEAAIRMLLETEVVTPHPDEEACRRIYALHPERFRSPDLFEPQHIFFRVLRSDAPGRAAALERARRVLDALEEAPERFGALARSLSDCPSAGDEGRLGQICSGEIAPEFEAALRRLSPGEICRVPVETKYGVHVLRLERRLEGRPLPFAQVHERIAAWLEAASWRRAVAQYVSLLVGHARITGIELRGAASPLVQ